MTRIDARHSAPLRIVILLAALSATMGALYGCLSPEEAVAQVDAEAYAIIDERQEQMLGTTTGFNVEPPIDRVMATAIDPETGLARPEVTVDLTLVDALRLAAVNSREFQTQKERLYRSALALMRQKENFRAFPFAFLSGTARALDNTESLGADAGFGLTQMLQRGGQYALDLGLDYLRIVSGGPDTLLSSSLALSISLPFLRNAGLEIVTENLTQASRTVLYSLRDFERFKQTYAVQVISSYLGVLTARQRVRNSEANVESLAYARKRNEAVFEEGQISIVEVDQARQRELQGENGLIAARQNSERQLDNFKNLIGLPVDLEVTVRMEDLDGLQDLIEENLKFDVPALTALGLRSRLDFRNSVDGVSDAIRRVKVAENQLLPDLGLDLSASATSENLKPLKYNFQNGLYTATVDFDPGLDRDLESISLRQALIDLQVALRAQEAAADSVKLDVRNAIRRLQVASETYEINLVEVALAENRVASTRVLLDLGRTTTRDFLDSQDDLLSSQNLLVEALVAYRVSYLELLRDTGVLAVNPGGLDYDATRALLEVD